jgi:hypothetical protein
MSDSLAFLSWLALSVSIKRWCLRVLTSSDNFSKTEIRIEKTGMTKGQHFIIQCLSHLLHLRVSLLDLNQVVLT